MKDFIKELYSERLEERENFLKALFDDYNRTGKDIFKELHLKEDSFFKKFREGKISFEMTQTIRDLLYLDTKDFLFIFSGRIEHEEELEDITKRTREHLEGMNPEEREDFLEELQRRIELLEECL